jgi:3-oxoacyl-[acyl-carrier protein] reductase
MSLLNEQIALVTGAGQGIGLSITEALLEHGASVLLCDVAEDQVSAAASRLNAGVRVAAARCDVTRNIDVEQAVASCVQKFGRVDILVNNAGITRDAYIAKMTEEAFDAVLGVSLKGSWLATRAVAPIMREQRSGSIINVSSLSGKMGNPAQTNYSAAKAGMIGLTKASAKEFGSAGVRVNAVMPGLIRSAMTLAMKPEIYAAKEKEVPLQRAGEPHEVAGAVVFLASPLASYITGAVIEVTGGRSM